MNDEERKYERIARYLDGESLRLDADERAVVEAIRQADAALRNRLDVELPAAVARRAFRRARVTAWARPRRTLRVALTRAGIAAAAAIVLLAVGWFWTSAGPTTVAPQARRTRELPTDVLRQSVAFTSDFDLELDLLAAEIEEQESEIAIRSEPAIVETELLDLQENVQRFWEDNAWDLPDEMETSGGV